MDPCPARDYDPIQPQGTNWRALARRVFAPVVAVAITVAKFTFVFVKFGSIFIAVGGYALLWGWTFGIGIVVLLLVHESGHYIEARREGLKPRLPVFIPFLGAYVRYTRGNPWQTARVALAGPILGGVGALAFYLVGHANGSNQLLALAYFGFLINLINLIPIGILDGGAIWRSATFLRRGGGAEKAFVTYALYFGTALALVIGMAASHVTQHRL